MGKNQYKNRHSPAQPAVRFNDPNYISPRKDYLAEKEVDLPSHTTHTVSNAWPPTICSHRASCQRHLPIFLFTIYPFYCRSVRSSNYLLTRHLRACLLPCGGPPLKRPPSATVLILIEHLLSPHMIRFQLDLFKTSY